MIRTVRSRLPPFLIAFGLILVVGCAPAREADDDDAASPPANDYDTALFTIVDYGDDMQWQDAQLVLVDADLGCDDLDTFGELETWQLDDDTDWLQLTLRRGVALDDWARDYPSVVSWQADGGVLDDSVAFFEGRMGTGPSEGPIDEPPQVDPGEPTDPSETDPDEDSTEGNNPDDPEDTPDVDPDGTDTPQQEQGIGSSPDGADDLLDVDLSNATLLAGQLRSELGNFDFAAQKCGVVLDEGNDTVPVEQPPG